jgi:hypothetical protein
MLFKIWLKFLLFRIILFLSYFFNDWILSINLTQFYIHYYGLECLYIHMKCNPLISDEFSFIYIMN